MLSSVEIETGEDTMESYGNPGDGEVTVYCMKKNRKKPKRFSSTEPLDKCSMYCFVLQPTFVFALIFVF